MAWSDPPRYWLRHTDATEFHDHDAPAPPGLRWAASASSSPLAVLPYPCVFLYVALLWLQHAYVREMAILLIPVQPIPYDKDIRDGETTVVNGDRHLPALRFVE